MNVSNYWPKTKVYNPSAAAAQCDSYFSSCGTAKRKAILTAWEKSKSHPVPTNGGDPGSESLGDSAAPRKVFQICDDCGEAVEECTCLPKSKAFDIED